MGKNKFAIKASKKGKSGFGKIKAKKPCTVPCERVKLAEDIRKSLSAEKKIRKADPTRIFAKRNDSEEFKQMKKDRNSLNGSKDFDVFGKFERGLDSAYGQYDSNTGETIFIGDLNTPVKDIKRIRYAISEKHFRIGADDSQRMALEAFERGDKLSVQQLRILNEAGLIDCGIYLITGNKEDITDAVKKNNKLRKRGKDPIFTGARLINVSPVFAQRGDARSIVMLGKASCVHNFFAAEIPLRLKDGWGNVIERFVCVKAWFAPANRVNQEENKFLFDVDFHHAKTPEQDDAGRLIGINLEKFNQNLTDEREELRAVSESAIMRELVPHQKVSVSPAMRKGQRFYIGKVAWIYGGKRPRKTLSGKLVMENIAQRVDAEDKTLWEVI